MNHPPTTSFWAVTAQMGMPSDSYARTNFTKYRAYDAMYLSSKVPPPDSNDPLASIHAGGVQGVAMILTAGLMARISRMTGVMKAVSRATENLDSDGSADPSS